MGWIVGVITNKLIFRKRYFFSQFPIWLHSNIDKDYLMRSYKHEIYTPNRGEVNCKLTPQPGR